MQRRVHGRREARTGVPGAAFASAMLIVLVLVSTAAPRAVAQILPSPRPAPQDQAAVDDPPARPIELADSPEQDDAIARRLRQIFAQLEGAGTVEVVVRSGVVTLSGEVPSPGARDRALGIARLVHGVVDVNDETELVRDVRRQLRPAVERLHELSTDAVGHAPLVLFALFVFALFWLLAVLVSRWSALYRRFTDNAFLADFLRQLTKLAVLAIGLHVAFELLDATALAGAVLGAAGLLGLALGFALRDTVENYIAGILLSTRRPFLHDDLVSVEGQEGRVLRLTARATVIMTPDGNHVRIPNAKVFNGVLVNYSRNPERRFWFDVGVGTDTNLAEAQELAARTVQHMEGVVGEPAPHADVQSLGDFNVVLRVHGWVDQRRHEFMKVRSEAIRLVKEVFDERGVIMPEPTYSVRTREPSEARTRRPTAGPKQAIDVERRPDIEREMAEERRTAGDGDMLRTDAPME